MSRWSSCFSTLARTHFGSYSFEIAFAESFELIALPLRPRGDMPGRRQDDIIATMTFFLPGAIILRPAWASRPSLTSHGAPQELVSALIASRNPPARVNRMVHRPHSSRTQRHGIVFSVASTMSRAKHDPMQAEIGASHSMQRRSRVIASYFLFGLGLPHLMHGST